MADTAATFLFADIAGFTALTEAHGDEVAIELLVSFSKAVEAQLPRIAAEHVKTIGDAVMLRVPEPADAVRLGLWITHDAMRDQAAPPSASAFTTATPSNGTAITSARASTSRLVSHRRLRAARFL
jgi:class 3 adenylate cyclase